MILKSFFVLKQGIIFDFDELEQNTNWIDTYKGISCMSTFETQSWTNFTKYIFGASSSHSSNMNFQTNPESTIGTGSSSPVKFSTPVPPIFSIGMM